MVESAIINTLIGCGVGALAGLIPGTGLLVSIMIMYPYLVDLGLIDLLCFYIGLSNLAQFTGSITAIYFGIPGEANSLPAAQEGYALYKKGHGQSAIIGTSLSSITAGIITLFLLIALSRYYETIFSYFYKTQNQLIIFLLSITVFLFFSKSKWYFTGLLMFFGYILGKVGFNEYTGKYFLSFGNFDLGTGIPSFPLIVGLLIVPQLYKKYDYVTNPNNIFLNTKSFLLFFKNITHTLIGTMVGFVCGLIPGVSTVLATNLSHKISKWLDSNNQPSYKALISAEASNNSAIIVTLLPLIVLGIPITGSEAFLLSIMDRNLIDINWQIILQNNFDFLIAISVMISLMLGIIISWPMSKILNQFLFTTRKYLKTFIFVILLGTIFVTASATDQVFYYLIVFVFASFIGLTLKKFDVLPLIFVFLIQNKLESVIIISYNLLT